MRENDSALSSICQRTLDSVAETVLMQVVSFRNCICLQDVVELIVKSDFRTLETIIVRLLKEAKIMRAGRLY
jgi:hypothetical protein